MDRIYAVYLKYSEKSTALETVTSEQLTDSESAREDKSKTWTSSHTKRIKRKRFLIRLLIFLAVTAYMGKNCETVLNKIYMTLDFGYYYCYYTYIIIFPTLLCIIIF